MPIAKSTATAQTVSLGNAEKDLLGITPLPVDNRQRYLRFMLSAKQEALIPLSNILEVIQLSFEDILPIPAMPSCVLGVCGWQSETLWLVDLNSLLGDTPFLQQAQSTAASPTVIVIQTQQKSLGLVVADVSDIDLFDPSQIRMERGICPPSLEPYVLGYCPEYAGTVLDVSKIVCSPLLQSH